MCCNSCTNLLSVELLNSNLDAADKESLVMSNSEYPSSSQGSLKNVHTFKDFLPAS